MRRSRVPGLALIEVPPRVEAALWRRLRFEAETGCRETLFMRYRGLARAIARRTSRARGPDKDDAEHFAYEGLLQAIDRYDPLRGVPFSAFARRRILGSMTDGAARQSEVAAQAARRSRTERERLSLLAREAAASPDALATLSALVTDLAVGLLLEDAGYAAADTSPDAQSGVYDTLAMRELVAILRQAVANLPAREALIIRLHYEDGVSFTHIADLMQLSKGRISQLHRAALAKLKRKMRSAT